jgi:hypothetical protein
VNDLSSKTLKKKATLVNVKDLIESKARSLLMARIRETLTVAAPLTVVAPLAATTTRATDR